MIKKIFLLGTAIAFLISCSSQGDESKKISIDVNAEIATDVPKIEIVSVKPIETSDESLFGDINTMEFFKGRYYIIDIFSSKAVMAFTSEGKFINKTRIGNGPDELVNPFALSVDKANEMVLVWDQTLSYMYMYDLDLNFIKKEKYQNPGILEFARLKNGDNLVRSHFDGDFTFKLYDKDFGVIKEKFIEDFKYEGAQGLARSVSENGKTYLISSYDYNIYEFSDQNISDVFYIDFGDKNIDKDDIEKGGMHGMQNLIATGVKVSSPHEIALSEDYIFFRVYFRDQNLQYLLSKDGEKVIRLNDYFDTGRLPVSNIRGVTDNNTFFGTIKPSDLIKYQIDNNIELVAGTINSQDNPFIIEFTVSK